MASRLLPPGPSAHALWPVPVRSPHGVCGGTCVAMYALKVSISFCVTGPLRESIAMEAAWVVKARPQVNVMAMTVDNRRGRFIFMSDAIDLLVNHARGSACAGGHPENFTCEYQLFYHSRRGV